MNTIFDYRSVERLDILILHMSVVMNINVAGS